MKTLVEDLLTLARADAGKLELECTTTDLKSLATDAVAMLRPIAEERSVDVTLKAFLHCAKGTQDDSRKSSPI